MPPPPAWGMPGGPPGSLAPPGGLAPPMMPNMPPLPMEQQQTRLLPGGLQPIPARTPGGLPPPPSFPSTAVGMTGMSPAPPSVMAPVKPPTAAAPVLVGESVGIASGHGQAAPFTEPQKENQLLPEAAILNTSTSFSGIALLLVRTLHILWVLILWGVTELRFLGIFLFIASLAACIFGLATLLRPEQTPRGLECIPVCAHAKVGCLSCPCVPWTLGLWGIFAFLATLMLVALEGFTLRCLDGISAIFLMLFGFCWLYTLKYQGGHFCCAPLAKTADEETGGDTSGDPKTQQAFPGVGDPSLPPRAPQGTAPPPHMPPGTNPIMGAYAAGLPPPHLSMPPPGLPGPGMPQHTAALPTLGANGPNQ